MKVIFVHGWGFDRTMWTGVLEHLPETVKTDFIDFGFTGQPRKPNRLLTERAVFVGHSLGSLWLLQRMTQPLAFIAVNGFDDFGSHVPRAFLGRMRRNVDRCMEQQMQMFYDACGTLLPDGVHFDTNALKWGLDILDTQQARKHYLTMTCPVVALAARDDQIVNQTMTRHIWRPDQIIWSDDGGHVLPITKPEWTARHLIEVLNGCG